MSKRTSGTGTNPAMHKGGTPMTVDDKITLERVKQAITPLLPEDVPVQWIQPSSFQSTSVQSVVSGNGGAITIATGIANVNDIAVTPDEDDEYLLLFVVPRDDSGTPLELNASNPSAAAILFPTGIYVDQAAAIAVEAWQIEAFGVYTDNANAVAWCRFGIQAVSGHASVMSIGYQVTISAAP